MTDSPHMFDPRINHGYIVWHEDPKLEAFIKNIIETVRPDRWIETGTHMGWTSIWVAKNFPHLPIYTVEVDEDYYRKSKENLAPFPQVSISHDSSPAFLSKLQPLLRRGLSMFWLDAHWWPPVPLKEECKIVASLDRYVCLIDDFSIWQPDFNGDTFFTEAPANGQGYMNDIAYVSSEMGERYWRNNYEPQPGYKGVGLFMKGVNFTPPSTMREETLDRFIELRAKSISEREHQADFYRFPLHPSCGRNIP